jgi:hypothetical protein
MRLGVGEFRFFGSSMTHLGAKPSTMLASWDQLDAELERWAARGDIACFWWRDDDATAPSPALDRLLALGEVVGIALAVIPSDAAEPLAARLRSCPRCRVVQHGWDHRDHAGPGEKKIELGGTRPLAALAAELRRGRDRLAALFGPRFLPVLVPPWNRIAPGVLPLLGELGFGALSTYGARPAAAPLRQVNTHADLMDWRAGVFLGAERALGLIVGHLAARREGRADADEPTGVLSHHLVHGAATEAFLERLIVTLRAHPACRWLAPAEVFTA